MHVSYMRRYTLSVPQTVLAVASCSSVVLNLRGYSDWTQFYIVYWTSWGSGLVPLFVTQACLCIIALNYDYLK